MNKKTFVFALMPIFLVVTLASFIVQKDDVVATKILGEVSKKYRSYKTIKAGFKVSMKSKQDQGNVTQSGTLYLKGKKFRIDMSGQEIYCDGKTLWTYLADANEVQITKYDPGKNEISPSSIFTIYQKGFIYKYTGEEMVKGKSVQKIELSPRDKAKPYFKVKLSVDKLGRNINDMTVFNKSGLESKYEITNFIPNVAITENTFKFDPKSKPGVVVIDLTK
jgi:outer membrane lipoprotein-sorting protein